jgi:tetratricopeptide (TPR) repeat protein
VEHRHFGIFCLGSPGVLRGERIYGASVLDIAPTILHLFGLPAGKDMDGKVLINAFADRRLPPRIPSWDEVPGEDGRHAPGEQYDGASAAESLKQLVALGYIAPPGDDERKTVEKCVQENRYNLARAWMDAGSPANAAEILRDLIAQDQEQGRFHHHLFECLLQRGDWKEAKEALDAFDRAAADFAPRAARELERRRTEKPDRDLVAERGETQEREIYERRELAEKAGGFGLQRLMLRCRLAGAQSSKTQHEQKAAARELLEQLAAQAGARRHLTLFLAQNFLALEDRERALEFARRARRADPESWEAMTLEARIHHAAGRHNEAVNCAIESLSLVYFQPVLHYILGLSLRRLGDEERAAEEFRVALAQAPGFPAAHDALAKILRRDLSRIGEASLHMAQAEDLRKRMKKRRERQKEKTERPAASAPVPAGPVAFERWEGTGPVERSRVVTIVSGLPRSGTSMMMQVLAAAGLELYSDQRRAADEDNPRGYFEHEQVSRLHRDASWLPQARGKVVKIVANLLPYLPPAGQYCIIFLHRNLEEVVASQRKMLARLNRAGARLTDEELTRTYARQLVTVQTWLRNRPETPVLAVKYGDALPNPSALAARLASFLGAPFQQEAAAAAVDASLRRQLAGATSASVRATSAGR